MTGLGRNPRGSAEVLIRGLSIDQLATFKAVVEGGSFRRGAEKRLISQPAVSQRIRQIEALIGAPLFDRRRGTSAQLTSSGQLLIGLADHVLDEVEHFYAQVSALNVTTEEGALRVAAGPSFIKYCLLGVARRFNDLYPDVDIRLQRSISPDHVMEAVLERGADLGVYSGAVPTRKLRSFTLRRELLRLVAPPGHPITRKSGSAALEELSRAPFALSCEGAHSRQLTEAWARHYGVPLRMKIEADNLDTLKEAVLQGVALAILPEFAIEAELDSGALARVDMPGLPLERQLSVVANVDPPLSAMQEAFVEVLASEFRT